MNSKFRKEAPYFLLAESLKVFDYSQIPTKANSTLLAFIFKKKTSSQKT